MPLAKKVLALMEKEGNSPKAIIDKLDLSSQSGDELKSIVKEVIKENKDVVAEYQSGKESAIQFLIGQVMAKTKGQADPKEAGGIIKKETKNKK